MPKTSNLNDDSLRERLVPVKNIFDSSAECQPTIQPNPICLEIDIASGHHAFQFSLNLRPVTAAASQIDRRSIPPAC